MNALQVIRNGLNKFKKDERGLSTVEYVIILVLIAAVCVATWSAFGKKVKDWLGKGESTIDNQVTSGAYSSQF